MDNCFSSCKLEQGCFFLPRKTQHAWNFFKDSFFVGPPKKYLICQRLAHSGYTSLKVVFPLICSVFCFRGPLTLCPSERGTHVRNKVRILMDFARSIGRTLNVSGRKCRLVCHVLLPAGSFQPKTIIHHCLALCQPAVGVICIKYLWTGGPSQ